MKRNEEDRNNPGKWECPGGKLDEGQDLSDALEREVMEETGLLVEGVERLALVDSRILVGGEYDGLTYVVIFSVARVVGGKLKLSTEHSEYMWTSYDELLELDLTNEVRKAAIILKSKLVSSN